MARKGNQFGRRVLGDAEFAKRQEEADRTKGGQFGPRLTGRGSSRERRQALALEAAERLKAARDRQVAAARARREAKDGAAPPAAVTGEVGPEGLGGLSVREAIATIRAPESDLEALAGQELGAPKPRKRVVETIVDEAQARGLEPAAALLEFLGVEGDEGEG